MTKEALIEQGYTSTEEIFQAWEVLKAIEKSKVEQENGKLACVALNRKTDKYGRKIATYQVYVKES